jgi:hypothetical protein
MKPFDILDHAHFVCGFKQVRATEPTPIPDIPMPGLSAWERPDNLDVIQMNNEAIEEVAASVEAAEFAHELPRMVYAPCCPVMKEESEQALLRG